MKHKKILDCILASFLFFCIINMASAQALYTIETDLTTNVDITAAQLDEFIKSKHQDSPLIGLGQAWIDAGNKYGINPVYLMAHAIHETGWGLGNDYLVLTKNNIYGYGAYDSDPNGKAATFSSREECIDFVAGKIKQNYLSFNGKYFHKEYGPTLKGMNVNYATDPEWGNKIVKIMNMFSDWQSKYQGYSGDNSQSSTQSPTENQVSASVEDVRIEKAVKWAESQIGSTDYYHDGTSWCLDFVEDAYESGAKSAPKRNWGNAKQAAIGLKAEKNTGIPPIGTLVFYEYKTYGHVGLSVGDGYVIHVPGESPIRKNHYTNVMGLKYIGWAAPPVTPPINIKYEWLFDVSGDLEGWEPHNVEGAKYSVEGGRLFIDPSGSDPWIERDGIYLDASSEKYINFKMSSNCPDNNGAVYFTTAESPNYGDEKKVEFTVLTGPEWHDYSVSMTQNPLWKGTVTGIRIDPANNGIENTDLDTTGFEYIKIEDTESKKSGDINIPSTAEIEQFLEKNPVNEKEITGAMGAINEFLQALADLFGKLFN